MSNGSEAREAGSGEDEMVEEAAYQVLAMLCVNDDGNVHDYDIDEAQRRIKGLRDAMTAAFRARVVAEAARLRREHTDGCYEEHGAFTDCNCDDFNAGLAALVAALTTDTERTG